MVCSSCCIPCCLINTYNPQCLSSVCPLPNRLWSSHGSGGCGVVLVICGGGGVVMVVVVELLP